MLDPMLLNIKINTSYIIKLIHSQATPSLSQSKSCTFILFLKQNFDFTRPLELKGSVNGVWELKINYNFYDYIKHIFKYM